MMRGGILLLVLLAGNQFLPGQQISGELKQWHDVVLTFDGPSTSESAEPNPFLYYRLDVTFTKGNRKYVVPGYFACDGNAAETSAKSGNRWRVDFIPDETGEWTYLTFFRSGPDVAVSMDPNAGKRLPPDGLHGTFKSDLPTNRDVITARKGRSRTSVNTTRSTADPANTSSRRERRARRISSRTSSSTIRSITVVPPTV